MPSNRPRPLGCRSRIALACALLVSLVVSLAPVAAGAVTYTWIGPYSRTTAIDDVRTRWSTADNWQGSLTPVSDGLNTDLVFAASASGTVPGLTGYWSSYNNSSPSFSMRSLTYAADATAYKIQGNLLRIGAGGIVNNASARQEIASAVTLFADQTWSLNRGPLVFFGGVNIGTNIARALTINVGASTSSPLTADLTGPGSLTKAGDGTLILSGNSTYTGVTFLTKGVLLASTAGAISNQSAIKFNGGTLAFGPTNTFDYSARFSTAADQAFNIDVFRGVTLAGNLTSVRGALRKLGTGTLTLSGNNTYDGGSSFVAGVLQVASAGALGSAGLLQFAGGTLQFSAANKVDYSARFSSAENQAFRVDTGGQDVGFTRGLRSVGGSIVKTGAGTLLLAGVGHEVGSASVQGGHLAISGSLNAASGLTVDTAAAAPTASLTMHSTSALSTGAAVVGLNGVGNALQDGGSFSTNGNVLTLGANAAANGTYTLRGAFGSLSTGQLDVGSGGTGRLVQQTGTVTTHGGDLRLATGIGSQGSFDFSGGSFATGRALVGSVGSGQVTQSGGSFTAGGVSVGDVGVGSWAQSGGSVSIGRDGLELGATAGRGTYHLSGGSLSATDVVVGGAGTGTFNHSGGQLAGRSLVLGRSAGSNGAYVMSGGILSITGALIGIDGNGSFTQSGGSFTSSKPLAIGAGAGTGTYHLTGGVLNTPAVAGQGGRSTFNFNGGTLRATASSTTFMQGLSMASVLAGGANFDTNGFDVTVAQALLHDPAAPAPAIDGGLTKLGAGTLTLTGANTLNGPVRIVGGTLAVAGESLLGSGGVTQTVRGAGRLLFTADTTLSRIYEVAQTTLVPGSGRTLTLASGAAIQGGNLGGPGRLVLGHGSALLGVTALSSSALVQDSGQASVSTSVLRGSLTQNGGTLALDNAILAAAGRLVVGGMVNTTGTELQGVTTVRVGGTLASSGDSLTLSGGSRTTVDIGGTLAVEPGSSVELNGGLLVNNGTQRGLLNVNYGSTAKGAGSFGDVVVADGGRFAPGNSPGTAAADSFSFRAGGRLDFELNSATPRPGIDADLLQVFGALSIEAGPTPNSRFTIGVHTLDLANQAAALVDFDASRAHRFLLVDAGSVSGFDSNLFAVDTSGFRNGMNGGSFRIGLAGNDLYLDFNPMAAPVPEPSAWLLMLGGMAGLVLRRQRAGRA